MKKLLPIALLLLSTTGCSLVFKGSGELSGESLTISACDGKNSRTFAPYRLAPAFFSMVRFENTAEILLQKDGQHPGVSDLLLIQIIDYDLVRASLGQTFALGGDSVRGVLQTFASCPDSYQSTALKGQIVFTALGSNLGDKVAATFTFDVVDPRHGDATIGTNFGGKFDFKVIKGRPYQYYPD